jgi:hypothetical protein
MYSAETINAKIFPYSAHGKINNLRMCRFRGEILARTFGLTPVPAESATLAERSGERKRYFPAPKRISGAKLPVGRNALRKTAHETQAFSSAIGIKMALLLT